MVKPVEILCRDVECRNTIEVYLASRQDIAPSVHCVIAEAEEAGNIPDCEVAVVLGNAPSPEKAGRVYSLPLPFRLSALGDVLAEAFQNSQQPCILSDEVVLRASERLLEHRKSNATLPLTEKETDLLSLLAVSAGIVPRETLIENIWAYQGGVTTRTLESHIWRLKKKLEQFTKNDARPLTIIAEDGGYKLTLIA